MLDTGSLFLVPCSWFFVLGSSCLVRGFAKGLSVISYWLLVNSLETRVQSPEGLQAGIGCKILNVLS